MDNNELLNKWWDSDSRKSPFSTVASTHGRCKCEDPVRVAHGSDE